MKILAECYANECIAQYLRNALSKQVKGLVPEGIKIRHKSVMGRDRILKDIIKEARNNRKELILAIIDYERGISRIFIDTQFNLKKLSGLSKVLIGDSRKSNNVVAIVFDPDIEEALLCRVKSVREICVRNPRELKRRDVCRRVISKHVKNKLIQGLINAIIKELIKHPKFKTQ